MTDSNPMPDFDASMSDSQPSKTSKGKKSSSLNLYRVHTRCGQYGGYVMAVAHDEAEAASLANEVWGANNPDCRDDVTAARVELLREARADEAYAVQMWDGAV